MPTEGRNCRRPCVWSILRGSSPGGLGGVPAVPGLRLVPSPPGFPALGASGLVAAAPPSPSKRSAAAGPNHRSHRGEAARCRSRRLLTLPADSGQGSRAAQVPGSQTVLCSAQPSLGLRDGRLCGPAAEANPFLPAGWHSLKSVGHRSSRRRGGARVRARPLSPAEGELGRPTEKWKGWSLARAGTWGGAITLKAHHVRAPNPSSPPPTRLSSSVDWLEVNEFMRKFHSKMSPKGVGEGTSLHPKPRNPGC